jgi:hypothetical protein
MSVGTKSLMVYYCMYIQGAGRCGWMPTPARHQPVPCSGGNGGAPAAKPQTYVAVFEASKALQLGAD